MAGLQPGGRAGVRKAMRMILACLFLLTSGAAMAQKEALKPAPVPGVLPGTGAPADRAGNSSSAESGTPFSGAPTGAIAGGGQATPQTLSAPASRETAPAPSVSR
jgi:hypothetical protein